MYEFKEYISHLTTPNHILPSYSDTEHIFASHKGGIGDVARKYHTEIRQHKQNYKRITKSYVCTAVL